MQIHPTEVADFEEKYDEDGYVIFRNSLNTKKIENLRSKTFEVVNRFSLSGESISETIVRLDKEDRPSLFQLALTLEKSYEFSDICLDFEEIMTTLYPGKRNFFMAQNLAQFGLPRDSRITFDWHQESVYLKDFDDFATFWFTPFDTTEETRGMSLLRGSHKLGKLNYDAFKLSKEHLLQHVPKNKKELEKQFEEVPVETVPGDMIVFHPSLIHKSGHNQSNKVRISFAVRIAAIGPVMPVNLCVNDACRNYTW